MMIHLNTYRKIWHSKFFHHPNNRLNYYSNNAHKKQYSDETLVHTKAPKKNCHFSSPELIYSWNNNCNELRMINHVMSEGLPEGAKL